MKKFLSLLIITLLAMPAFAKDITIVASPPEGVIKVNGSYYGEGSAKVKVKKDDFVIIEVSAPGYETLTTRVYGRDDRKTIEIKLKEDVILKQTVESSLATPKPATATAKRLGNWFTTFCSTTSMKSRPPIWHRATSRPPT